MENPQRSDYRIAVRLSLVAILQPNAHIVVWSMKQRESINFRNWGSGSVGGLHVVVPRDQRRAVAYIYVALHYASETICLTAAGIYGISSPKQSAVKLDAPVWVVSGSELQITPPGADHSNPIEVVVEAYGIERRLAPVVEGAESAAFPSEQVFRLRQEVVGAVSGKRHAAIPGFIDSVEP